MNALNGFANNALFALPARFCAAVVLAAVSGCCSPQAESSQGSHAEAPSGAAACDVSASQQVAIPAAGESVRIGGDPQAAVTGQDGDYRSGACRIDTPLPAGYPKPTPPGAIELKTYPAARIAEVTGTGDPDRGMNRAFWPLFNHIKSHEIAMTSPVEMNYEGLDGGSTKRPQSWSMGFLYRTPDMNTTGKDGAVEVRDVEPMTVLSIGLKGDYSMSLVQRGRRALREILAANPQWEIAGDWRALYYNGPSLAFWNKWAEVQVPVRGVKDPAMAPK